MTTSFGNLKAPPLWAKCLVASIVLHSAAFYVLIRHPITLKNPLGSFFAKNKPVPTFINAEEEWDPNALVLEHFFEEIPFSSQRFSPLQKNQKLPSLLSLDKPQEELEIKTPFPKFLKEVKSQNVQKINLPNLVSSEEKETLPFIKTPLAPIHPIRSPYIAETRDPDLFKQENEMSLVLVDDFPSESTFTVIAPSKEFKEQTVEFTPDSSLALQPVSSDNFTDTASIFIQESSHESLFTDRPISFSFEMSPGALTESSFADINQYLSDELLAALEWNEDFQIESSFFPENEGYVFSLAITPKKDFIEERMKQNFYFLIDISSEIEKHKLSVFKKSVVKALSTLQPGDSFNILLLDKKIIKLSPHNLFLSPQNIHLAEEFLEKGGERDLFSSLHVYKGISEVLSLIQDSGEVHTAVLLTNGKSSLDPKDLRKLLEANQGKMNLFAAAVGQNNDLMPLDMLSSFLGGKLLYSDTNAAFPRKFSTFIKGLQSPIAKNLSVSVYANDPKAHLKMATFANQAPNLYNKSSFTVMGKIDRLCDLHLVLQGTGAKDQIFLKKVVLFEEATPSTQSMKKEWALQQKTDHYAKYLTEAKASHLKQAREVLQTVYGKAFAQ